jgi:SAM-dependent methyltransferase
MENPTDYLWLHLRELPYFRALLRAVESRFYQEIAFPTPVLDLGCGDGQFADITFDYPLDVGVDPWWGPLREAQERYTYRLLSQADGARLPFPEGYFSSAISNSVLEHIPLVDDVLAELSRVLIPGAVFAFSVPNHRFLPTLSLGRWLDQLGLHSLGDAYRGFFNRISRHYHCDPPDIWEIRLENAGFQLEKLWHYFSPAALHALEWGHYFGLPSWVSKMTTGRWILSPTPWNLVFTRRHVQKYYYESPTQERGVYTFYLATRR